MTDTDTSTEAVENLCHDCATAIIALADTFPTGKSILADCIKVQSALLTERDRYKDRAEAAEGALSGVAANSTDKKARFIATEALAQIDAEPDKFGGE